MINPRTAPDLYDVIKLAGSRSPGVARFPNGPPLRLEGWEKQAGKGTAGARLLHTAIAPIEFLVELWITTPAHRAAWETWKAILSTPTDVTVTKQGSLPQSFVDEITAARARANRLPAAEKAARIRDLDAQVAAKKASLATSSKEVRSLEISHPYLAEIECTKVVVASWAPPGMKSGKPIPAKINFLEDRPLVVTGSGLVNGSIVGGGNPRNGVGSGADPNRDLKDRIAAKTREYDAV